MDITATGPNGLPIIFWRIEQSDYKTVAALLNAGFDIETPGFQQATPLIAAAVIDDWRMVKLLLDAGADPTVADRRGFTLGWLASKSRVVESSKDFTPLQEVKAIFAARGDMQTVLPPDVVKPLVRSGRWPQN